MSPLLFELVVIGGFCMVHHEWLYDFTVVFMNLPAWRRISDREIAQWVQEEV